MKKISLILSFASLLLSASTKGQLPRAVWAEPYFTGLTEAQPKVVFGGMAVALAVNPADDNEIIAASHTGGLHKSFNKGVSWNSLFGFPGGHWVTHVQYAPANPNHVIVTTTFNIPTSINEGGIWISRDRGNTWEKPVSGVPPPDIHTGSNLMANCIAVFPGSRRILVGTNMGLAISYDDGLTWEYQVVPGTAVLSAALMRGNSMVIATPAGIYYWSIIHRDWRREITGIGTAYADIVSHNSLYVPAVFSSNVNAATPVFVTTSDGRIHFSRSGGQTWQQVDTLPERINGFAKGTVFVKMALAGNTPSSSGLDLYVTNKLGVWKKYCPRIAAAPDFRFDFSERWQLLSNEHSDFSDMCTDNAGNMLFIAGDGGIQRFNGNAFGFAGGGNGNNNFNALQITEVSGMYINSRRQYDMYFGTQDNSLFASSDVGRNWDHVTHAEGFYFEHPASVASEENALISYVAGSADVNCISGRLYSNQQAVKRPARQITSSLKFLKTGTYLTNTVITPSDISFAVPPGSPPVAFTRYYITGNYNSPAAIPVHRQLFELTGVNTRGMPQKSATNDPSQFVVYQPFKIASGNGVDEQALTERVKLMRMMVRAETNAAGNLINVAGESRFPTCRGLGSIGVFPTNFAYYEVFAVNPLSNNHIIAADALNKKMVQSFNGGDDWSEMPELTALVTEGGARPFNIGRFTNASHLKFSTDFTGFILAGTRESGIFYSWNNGRNWDKIPGSEVIPEVSSFFFQNPGTVWVSSYGRGLWKLFFTYRQARPAFFYALRSMIQLNTLLDQNLIQRLTSESNNENSSTMGKDDFDQAISIARGTIENIYMENGQVTGIEYSPNGTPVICSDEQNKEKAAVPVFEKGDEQKIYGQKMDKLSELVQQGYYVNAVLLKNNQLVDIIYGREPLLFPDEIKPEEYRPTGDEKINNDLIPDFAISTGNMASGYWSLCNDEKLTIYGKDFDSQVSYPVQIFIDDQLTNIFGDIVPGKTGTFSASAPIRLSPGIHTIRMKQSDGQQIIKQESELFIVNTCDGSEEKLNNQDKKKEKEIPLLKKADEIRNKIKQIIKQ